MAMHNGACLEIIKQVMCRAKLKLKEHVNKNGLGLLNRCGPFFEEKQYDTPQKRRSNAESYQHILKLAKEQDEVRRCNLSLVAMAA